MGYSVGYLIGRFAYEPLGTHLCIYDTKSPGTAVFPAVLRKVSIVDWKNVETGVVVDTQLLSKGIVKNKAGWALL